MSWLNKYSEVVAKAQKGKTIGNLSPKQVDNVEKQREWINNWNKNRVINNKKINSNVEIPISEDIYIDDLNSSTSDNKKFNNLGEFDSLTNRIVFDENYTDRQGIPTHVFTHRFQKDLKNKNFKTYKEYIDTPIQNMSKNNSQKDAYLSDPEEIHSELMRMRYNNNFQPGQTINTQDLKNLENYNLKQFSDKELTELLNTTAINDNSELISMQKGGTIKPIYVNDKNDPRYRAYQDSLSAYTTSNNLKNKIESSKEFPNPENLKTTFSITGESRSMLPKTKLKKLMAHPDSDPKKDFSKYNSGTGKIMKPIDVLKYPSEKWYSIEAGILPIYKKPTLPVLTKQNIDADNQGNTFSTGYDKLIGRPQLVQRIRKIEPREKVNQIQNYLTPQGIETEKQDFETDLNIKQVTQQPKYYDITDKVNQNFGGSETSYKWYPQDGNSLQELSQEKYEDGTLYNQRTIVPRFQGGGIIKDDMGQYNHPGSVTKINSPNITMKNVKQRLLGISDTGDMQLMYPEQEYKFKGKNVTEFPISNNAKSLSKNWLDNY